MNNVEEPTTWVDWFINCLGFAAAIGMVLAALWAFGFIAEF